LREEHTLQVSKSKTLRKISGPEKDNINNLRYYITRNFVIYTGHLLLLGW